MPASVLSYGNNVIVDCMQVAEGWISVYYNCVIIRDIYQSLQDFLVEFRTSQLMDRINYDMNSRIFIVKAEFNIGNVLG